MPTVPIFCPACGCSPGLLRVGGRPPCRIEHLRYEETPDGWQTVADITCHGKAPGCRGADLDDIGDESIEGEREVSA